MYICEVAFKATVGYAFRTLAAIPKDRERKLVKSVTGPRPVLTQPRNKNRI